MLHAWVTDLSRLAFFSLEPPADSGEPGLSRFNCFNEGAGWIGRKLAIVSADATDDDLAIQADERRSRHAMGAGVS